MAVSAAYRTRFTARDHQFGEHTTFRTRRAPSNGLPISRCERTTATCQNTHDLAREAVGCRDVFGRWSLVPICCQHDHTTPAHDHAQHDGRLVESPPAHDHTRHDQRSAPRAPVPRRHNGHSARRAFVPRLHNRHRHDGIGTTGYRHSDALFTKKGVPTTFPSGRTDCPSAAASAPHNRVKMPAISRAKRSAASHHHGGP